MIKAASLDINEDLREFSRLLSEHGLVHRINEESGRQVIWVNSEAEAESVRQALKAWREQPVARQAGSGQDTARVPPGSIGRFFSQQLLANPVTMALIALCLLVALVSRLGLQADRVAFLFFPLVSSDNPLALLADLANPVLLLRSMTPMFLHFGELHLIFNVLWLWYFGRQLEGIQPGWVFLGVVLILALVSNSTQYLTTHYNNFGGMSGVVYGLVGYTWVIHNFMPRSRLLLNNSMFVFFVIALILMEIFAGSWIATAAHVGGLIGGLVLGVIAVLVYRLLLGRSVISKTGG